jgi:hypothetical protein
MRRRRRHGEARLPSGLAEVELFAFWEVDVASDLTDEPVPVSPPGPHRTDPSAAPLWWALGLLTLVLSIVLLG